ncbi:nucleotidyl transferase AbiEii/AbiGii toxin family protein [Collinsella sp. zg1085]|uniref:nucleotidyl transferase AbiEii/AbiGii toxin family protein n=1 Tax=Collinsella sp. zg1085 TaxID=2844380 RepID=UPI001C0C57EB|nr:nucleotidyl transferase AbiEii/AbiGii toxin family protein [Collinsella sp. zg1085]QWT17527.1 nucleotidyl transferase AbiEii/AbiGii toxin family protein [Collinsella sp. zg1085]
MDLAQIRDAYIDDGLDYQNATVRTCRDVVLTLIAASRMADHVTVKGGVVMQQISGDRRRATRDLDLDFVRYPMTDESICVFINALCPPDSVVRIDIIAPVEDLKHQDYRGKRVHLRVTDGFGTSMEMKLDLGVHDKLSLEQDELWFDSALSDDGMTLMANSKEQVCAEKLRSLMRIGAASTRFKDVFDVYYLLCREGVEPDAFDRAMRVLVYDDSGMRENCAGDVCTRLARVLGDRRFRRNLANARNNWLGANVDKVTAGILRYFE